MWTRLVDIEHRTRVLSAIWQGSSLLGVCMIGVVWIGFSLGFESKRRDVERAAVHNSESLARALEEHLSQSLQQIDGSLKILRKRVGPLDPARQLN
jgi:hypothetical protein